MGKPKNEQSEVKSESQLNAEANEPAPIFGKVRFGIPTKRTVSTKWGRVSVLMAECVVPILNTGIAIKAAMYANLEQRSDGVMIIPQASISGKFVAAEVDGAVDDLAAWIENAASEWDGYETAYAASAAALLGHAGDTKAANEVMKGARVKVERPVLARLVTAGGAKVIGTAPVTATANAPAA